MCARPTGMRRERVLGLPNTGRGTTDPDSIVWGGAAAAMLARQVIMPCRCRPAARHVPRGGSGRPAGLLPGFRGMGLGCSPGCGTLPSTPSPRTERAVFDRRRLQCQAALASGIQQTVREGSDRPGSSPPKVSISARMSFIRGLPWPIGRLPHRSVEDADALAGWLRSLAPGRGRSRHRKDLADEPPCPAGHRAQPATSGRGALAARRFRRGVNLVHDGAAPTARLLARAFRRPRTFVRTGLGG